MNRFWKNLKAVEGEFAVNMPMVLDDWKQVGFQGKDPATDFRGVGILGLDNLLAITDEGSPYRDEAKKMYQDSINPECWYYFAVTGLSITKKLLDAFTEEHRFDEVILENLDQVLKMNSAKVESAKQKISDSNSKNKKSGGAPSSEAIQAQLR